LQQRQHAFATVDAHCDDDRYQNHGHDDQVVADAHDRLLEMADRDGRLNQFRGPAEIGFGAGGVDHGADFAAPQYRA
jgi:hypothetical protein